jgi:hypothetical protein
MCMQEKKAVSLLHLILSLLVRQVTRKVQREREREREQDAVVLRTHRTNFPLHYTVMFCIHVAKQDCRILKKNPRPRPLRWQ